MKILHIISGANPRSGGPIQGIRNYESEIIHYKTTQRYLVCFEDAAEVAQWDFPPSLHMYPLGKPKTPWQFNASLLPFLEKEIRSFDIFIVNGLWSYHSYAAIKAVLGFRKKYPKEKSPKIYIMPHGMLDPWFQKDPSRRWKSIRNSIYWYFIEKNVINSADGLLFTCEEELLLARTSFKGYHPKKEFNIGYGIEAPPVKSNSMMAAFQEDCAINAHESYLLFLSRIHPKKGLDLLLQAYEQLLSTPEYINQLPILVVAGPGIESDYGKKLVDYMEKHPKVKAKVRLLGHLSGDAKWAAIYGCEAFVLPSHQENFGIAVAEALACYKPVLISNKVNIYREIEDGGGGFINEDSLEGTVVLLKNWMNSSEGIQIQMGEDAFSVYEKHFDVKNAVSKLMSVIETN